MYCKCQYWIYGCFYAGFVSLKKHSLEGIENMVFMTNFYTLHTNMSKLMNYDVKEIQAEAL